MRARAATDIDLHGRLNGGGVPLTIHTSDGNVKIAQL